MQDRPMPGSGAPGDERYLQFLRDRAVSATDQAVVLSDPRQDDNPLIWVNPAFTRLTGYSSAEAVGQNCRFLQAQDSDRSTVDAVRRALAQGEGIAVTLLNQRKDGSLFWSHFSISPIFGEAGELVSFVGVQSDVSEQVRLDVAHNRALAAERTATAETERARARLSELYEREHRAAETLQRSLLPNLPKVAGTTIAARYLPGEDTADVGGDFYEILPLPDGSIGFAIGDVVGHDLAAAAAMGHLRGLLQACAWDDATAAGGGDPGRVLNRVDRLVQGLDVVPLATLFYGRLTLSGTAEPSRFHYANAGHPAPLLRLPSGEVRRLDQGAGVLLGVTDLGRHPTAEVTLPAGSVLVGYTDGLVERRGVDIEEGIAALADALASLAPDADPEKIVTALVDVAGADRDDDVAMLVVRVDQ